MHEAAFKLLLCGASGANSQEYVANVRNRCFLLRDLERHGPSSKHCLVFLAAGLDSPLGTQ